MKLLTNPRLAGWRVYQGKIATDKDGRQLAVVLAHLAEHALEVEEEPWRRSWGRKRPATGVPARVVSDPGPVSQE
ncbi:hypothetical protein FRAHR75_400070 [Frankia sp. Hr75.2]|nr:hypothetical protein FRAHR75_400070 [Frankia sp. Hr75.2]